MGFKFNMRLFFWEFGVEVKFEFEQFIIEICYGFFEISDCLDKGVVVDQFDVVWEICMFEGFDYLFELVIEVDCDGGFFGFGFYFFSCLLVSFCIESIFDVVQLFFQFWVVEFFFY